MQIDRGDLQVTGADGSSYAVRQFEYDRERKTATWTFDRAFGADRLNAVLDGDGFRYEFPLNVLPGDVDRSGRVNALDVAMVKKHLGAEYTGQPFPNFINNYLSITDVNADGHVNALDVAAVKRDLAGSLPATPTATALLR